MKVWEKEEEKIKLAACFRLILKQKKEVSENNKIENIEDIHLVASMRQLEADSGVSFTLIQKLFAGKRDAQFTSIINLLNSLKISFLDFAILYSGLNDEQIEEVKLAISQGKKVKSIKSKKAK